MAETVLRKMSIWLAILAVALVAGWVGFQAASGNSPADIGGKRGIQLLNKNDGKDNCPFDGNAGTGNDTKGPNGGCRPPKGNYKHLEG